MAACFITAKFSQERNNENRNTVDKSITPQRKITHQLIQHVL